MRKRGRPALGNKKAKLTAFTLSPLAYSNLLKIPAGQRSFRVSKFLERINPELDVRTPGIRLAPEPQMETTAQAPVVQLTEDIMKELPKLTEVPESKNNETKSQITERDLDE